MRQSDAVRGSSFSNNTFSNLSLKNYGILTTLPCGPIPHGQPPSIGFTPGVLTIDRFKTNNTLRVSLVSMRSLTQNVREGLSAFCRFSEVAHKILLASDWKIPHRLDIHSTPLIISKLRFCIQQFLRSSKNYCFENEFSILYTGNTLEKNPIFKRNRYCK